MHTKHQFKDMMDFLADYITRQLGSGVHTSRVVRNAKRIGDTLGVEINLLTLHKNAILTLSEDGNDFFETRVVSIPVYPVSFQLNSDLSALSWRAQDEKMSLSDIKECYRLIISKPRLNHKVIIVGVALANSAFCHLFGGDGIAMGFVFLCTLCGFSLKQWLTNRNVNNYIVVVIAALISSAIASLSILFDCNANIALATSPLFLVPGVPLINGFIDIVEGYVLIGLSRLLNALLLIICISVGLSITLMAIKNQLL